MELEEILGDSESGLESEFDDLDLSSTDDEEDEENNIPAPNTQKRYVARKWCSSGFVPKDLDFPIKHQRSTKNSKSEEANHLTIFEHFSTTT